MNLMENKYLLFNNIEFNGNILKNITDFNILPDIPPKYLSENYILVLQLEDNRLIESICFELYETTAYWDILYAINGIKNSSELPVSYDLVLNRARKAIDDWIEVSSYMISETISSQYYTLIEELDNGVTIKLVEAPNSKNELVKRKYLEILQEQIDINETYRNFKYISLSDMGELEAALLSNKQTPKIDPNLIINITDS